MSSHPILIVDQEKTVRESLHLVFSEEGFRCFSTADEQQALRWLLSESISLLVLDSQVKGLQMFLQTIRKKAYPSLKIILISSYAETEVTQQALAHGADDFILKPIDFDELIDCIKKHLLSSQ